MNVVLNISAGENTLNMHFGLCSIKLKTLDKRMFDKSMTCLSMFVPASSKLCHQVLIGPAVQHQSSSAW